LAKKEAAAPPPPAYQLPHHREHVYESRQLGLIQLFSNYQVVIIKNTNPFRDLHTRRCLALRFWEVVPTARTIKA
jgi:hypothetical protein